MKRPLSFVLSLCFGMVCLLAASLALPFSAGLALAKHERVYIPVLNYHSITYDPGNTAAISPEKFEEQMLYLADQGYTTLTLQQFTDILEGKEKPPRRPVLLTFDDGYRDNYTYAYPLLQRLGFHATLFLTPGWVDDPYYLHWEQAREMQEAGWDIQPHGMSHPALTKLSAEEQAFEILEARRLIEEQLGTTADVFCYPYGKYNATTLQILKDHGFRYAFTIQQGKTNASQPPFELKRIFVNGEEPLRKLIHRLEKW